MYIFTKKPTYYTSESQKQLEFTYTAMVCRKLSISRRMCELIYAGLSLLVGDSDRGGKLFNVNLNTHTLVSSNCK